MSRIDFNVENYNHGIDTNIQCKEKEMQDISTLMLYSVKDMEEIKLYEHHQYGRYDCESIGKHLFQID